MGARESLNRRKNIARRKVRTARRAPGDNVLPDQFQTVAAVLPSDWAEKHKRFLAPFQYITHISVYYRMFGGTYICRYVMFKHACT